jgi:hypothetical protein
LTDGLNRFGLNILPSGYYDGNTIESVGEIATMWCYPTEKYENKPYIKVFSYNQGGVGQRLGDNTIKSSVRLVKDYTKDNYKNIENILGSLYPTKLIYFTHEGIDYAKIWTEINFYSNIETFDGIHSEELENKITGKTVYFINECFINDENENKWRKKALNNGDSVVIANYEDFEYHEWRIIDDRIVNTIESVLINSDEGFSILDKKIEEEIKNRKIVDNELNVKISNTNNRILKVENNLKVLDVNYDVETKNICLNLGNGEFSKGFSANDFIINGMLENVIYDETEQTLLFIFNTDEGEREIKVSLTNFLDISEFNTRIKQLESTINILEQTINDLNNIIKQTVKDYIKGSDDIKVNDDGTQLCIGFADDAIFGDDNFK